MMFDDFDIQMQADEIFSDYYPEVEELYDYYEKDNISFYDDY